LVRNYLVYIGLWMGPEKIFTKYRISINVEDYIDVAW
jgi:hypothetical protein